MRPAKAHMLRSAVHRTCLPVRALAGGRLVSAMRLRSPALPSLRTFASQTARHSSARKPLLNGGAKSSGSFPRMAKLDLPSDNGPSVKVFLRPSYTHKPKAVENLLKSLPPLLGDAGIPPTPVRSFGTKSWDLDESGDTIHRHVSMRSEQDVRKVLESIESVSKELNHDPHMHVEGSQITISCTTHVPPGLSMKDVKLAKKIDQILENFDLTEDEYGCHDEAEVLGRRQRAVQYNMAAIERAKQDCTCG